MTRPNASAATRATMYAFLIRTALICVDDIRIAEGLPPLNRADRSN